MRTLKTEQLQTLGRQVRNLAFIWYGFCDPDEKANEIAARTGIKLGVIQAALCAADGGVVHAQSD